MRHFDQEEEEEEIQVDQCMLHAVLSNATP